MEAFGRDITGELVAAARKVIPPQTLKDDEFCIKHDEFCFKNDGFCSRYDELLIKNDEFCIKNGAFCIKGRDHPWVVLFKHRLVRRRHAHRPVGKT